MCEEPNGKIGSLIKRKETVASNFSRIINSQEYTEGY